MLTRALLVLLVVLNAGVGLWWLMRPMPVAAVPATPSRGAPRLVLLREQAPLPAATDVVATVLPPVITGPAADTASLAATVPAAAPPAVVPAVVPPEAAGTMPTPVATAIAARCYSVGPFTDATVLARVRGSLQPRTSALQVREVAPAAGRGWQVSIGPAADRDAAQQLATAIGAAGFDDFFVVPASNAIALGRYAGEASARGREAALRAKGFAAIAEPIGAGPARTWLDVTVRDAAVDRAWLATAAGDVAVEPKACKAVAANVAARAAGQSTPPAR